MDTNYKIFIGNYGSGKTELALNFALQSAKLGKKTVLVDLDIVNPYFRSSEQKGMLDKAGVELISPPYAMTGVDLPVLCANVLKVFNLPYDEVIFDVGGDTAGATALGRYKQYFDKILENLLVLFVVNTRRPNTSNAQEICELMANIEHASRLKINGLINNANLARQSSAKLLIEGKAILDEVTSITGMKTLYTSATQNIVQEIKRENICTEGEIFTISLFTRPLWLDFE